MAESEYRRSARTATVLRNAAAVSSRSRRPYQREERSRREGSAGHRVGSTEVCAGRRQTSDSPRSASSGGRGDRIRYRGVGISDIGVG